jgi:cell wall-associated NlpC family hydrolase
MARAATVATTSAGAVVLGVLGLTALPLGPSGGELAPRAVPAAYAPLITKYGHGCPQLTPALLAAQLHQESGFNPKAISPKGALGLAQFLPNTWRTYGVDANGDGKADPFNPADAIATAAVYDCTLARDLHATPGDRVDAMLAGYNAGPYAVLRYGGVPPYAETQGYVRSIRDLATQLSTGGVQPVAASSQAAGAVAFAYRMLGTPYEWGGTGTDGRFDCSGLTSVAYAAAGVHLPRTAAEQWYAGPHVPRAGLQAGDLVFFAADLNDPATIHHVGIYVGNGQMIDAPHTGAVIRFDPVDQPDYIGAARP